jgi:hypothetical protein
VLPSSRPQKLGKQIKQGSLTMEDYDDGLGQAHQQDLLRQQEIEEDLGLFSPVYVLPRQQLTAEILYFKSMEAF